MNKVKIGQECNSSYNLTASEERLLCSGWNFCIENKVTNFINFKTDMESTACKIQTHFNSDTFSPIYRKIYYTTWRRI